MSKTSRLANSLAALAVMCTFTTANAFVITCEEGPLINGYVPAEEMTLRVEYNSADVTLISSEADLSSDDEVRTQSDLTYLKVDTGDIAINSNRRTTTIVDASGNYMIFELIWEDKNRSDRLNVTSSSKKGWPGKLASILKRGAQSGCFLKIQNSTMTKEIEVPPVYPSSRRP